jgi:hypothetical protein
MIKKYDCLVVMLLVAHGTSFSMMMKLSKKIIHKPLVVQLKRSNSYCTNAEFGQLELYRNLITEKYRKRVCQVDKNKAMERLLRETNEVNYKYRRYAACVLVCAGADNTAYRCCSLLKRAIYQGDKEMIAVLFENNVNPNQRNSEGPDWFASKDVDVAKMFISRGVDVNAEGRGKPNVLWPTISWHPSPALIDLYLKSNVDAKKRDDRTGNTILHHLVECSGIPYLKDLDDYVKIGALLLKANPGMVNVINNDGYTPLRLIRKKLKGWIFCGEKEKLDALAALIKNYKNLINVLQNYNAE